MVLLVVVVVVVVVKLSERGSRSKSAVEFEGGQCVSGASTGWREWARRTKITDGDGQGAGRLRQRARTPCKLGTWVRYHGGGGLETAMLACLSDCPWCARQRGQRASQVGQRETVMQRPG